MTAYMMCHIEAVIARKQESTCLFASYSLCLAFFVCWCNFSRIPDSQKNIVSKSKQRNNAFYLYRTRAMIQIQLILFLYALVVCCIHGYDVGEKVSFSARSAHATKGVGWRTVWVDMPFYLAPRFGIEEEKVFHAPILAHVQSDGANGTRSELIVDEDRLASFRIDPEVDFRVGLSFDKHQQEITWITVYEAAMRRTLQKLEVEFSHDSYDVVSLQYKTHCKLLPTRIPRKTYISVLYLLYSLF